MKSLFSYFGHALAILFLFPLPLLAEDTPLTQEKAPVELRTVVADLLMVDGDLYVVRGERGEIRIEVRPETNVTEEFTFGDRIKAILLPNDVARSITRAAPDDAIGVTRMTPSPPSVPPEKVTPRQSAEEKKTEEAPPPPPTAKTPEVRVIIADILMVDGDFYIVRSEHGEIQIEVTPKTQLEETFQFGDRIKARVTPNDKAISVVRASKDDVPGVHMEQGASTSSSSPPKKRPEEKSQTAATPSKAPKEPQGTASPSNPPPEIRIIVADILMVDGDFFVVRGDRGEIRIEVTPKTTITESFGFGDRIKAQVLPNDRALTIERASPDDPIGIQKPK